MSVLVQKATSRIRACLIAALNASPLSPGLEEEDLRALVVGQDGIGLGAFQDAMESCGRLRQGDDGLFRAHAMDISFILTRSAPVPEEIRPRNALNQLGQAFDSLANEQGRSFGANRILLHARCSGVVPNDVDRALALLTVWGAVSESGDKFVREREWPPYNARMENDNFLADLGEQAKEALPAVVDIFTRRKGHHVPSEPPIDRFGRFLLKQGWVALAQWWSQTVREMRAMNEQTSPTSICVLCGALLEAALTAIAAPAREAKEWRQGFLEKPVETWKAGALVDQARASTLFSDAQAAHAETMLDMRNRIHAGKFAKEGKLEPPYTNAHEAQTARLHLDVLLVAILEWPVVASLT